MRKILPLILCVMVVLSLDLKAQCIYVSQPGPTEGIDAVCHRYPLCGVPGTACDTSNRSNSKHIYASAKQLGGVPRIMRSFVKFDFSDFGQVETKALPSSGILNLYYFRAALSGDEHLKPTDNAFYIERIVENWQDDTIRWQKPVSSGNLRMPNVAVKTNSKNRILVSATGTNSSDATIDISDMVRFWFEKPDSNFGFRIKLVDETSERQVHFCSSDYGDAQFRPKMTIEFPEVIASAGLDAIACEGSGLKLQGSGGAVYNWIALDAGNDILSKYDIPNPLLNGTKAQSYAVEVGIGTCKDKDTVFIDFGIPRPAKITIPAQDTFLCLGDSVQLEATGGTFFKWSPSDVLNDDELPGPWCKPVGSVRLYVSTISAGDKCPGIDSVDIDIKTQTDGKLSFTDTTVCRGDSVEFSASGGVTYSWTPADSLNNSTIPNPIAAVKSSKEFIVAIEGLNACPDYDTVTVTVVNSISVFAGDEQTICAGETVQLSGTGNGTYLWDNSESLDDAFSQTPNASPVVTTTYTLKVSGNNCAGQDTVMITVMPSPTISTGYTDTLICANENVTLTVDGADFYWWSTEETSDKIIVRNDNPNSTQTYQVVGTTDNCNSDTLEIKVSSQRCGSPYVITPKFFSPNNDGINDYFVIKDIKRYENEVIIINKWGDVVYRKNDYDNRWDGTYNGQDVAEDTYMYYVRVKVDDTWEEEKGTITLLRTSN